MSATRPGHEQRRGAEVLGEEPAELAASQTYPPSELVDRRLVENAALDQADRAGNDRGGADPGGRPWRRIRPAAATRTEASLLRRRGADEEADVLAQRRARWADRTAVDAGGLHGGEEPSVEPRVAAPRCPIAGVFVEHHGPASYRRAQIGAGGNRTWTIQGRQWRSRRTVNTGDACTVKAAQGR